MALIRDPMFWMSVIGTITGVVGLYYSILAWRAADSAKEAAKTAANQIRGINALLETSRLQMLCREIMNLFDARSYKYAKYRVREVRQGVNQLKNHPSTNGHLEPQIWEQITADLADIEYALQDAKDKQKFDGVRLCEERISTIDEHLVIIATKCQSFAEELK